MNEAVTLSIEAAVNERRLAHIIRFAAAHGVDAFVASDGVSVHLLIPWSNCATLETGLHTFVCRSWRDVKIALGY